MAKFLVCYGTGEGQTAKVAERLAERLDERGHEATAVNVGDRSGDRSVAAFDAVLVGASIHAGKHQPAVVEFVEANRDAMATKPTGFFQVSLSSADEEGEAQAAGYVDSFVSETDWHPDRIGLFGGALRYSEYGFLKRLMMKQIAKRTLPDVDTSRDVEFTDWAEVDAFAADFAAFAEGRLGVVPPGTDASDGSRAESSE
ncbi:flavodoxin domain-containing protein [Haloprofundus sp. MHR1]|uniref:flavodoxin domain-containing protein n=1 Tax=Haloprofundus sp. MHR1 TaxID=2572921 RepID=UPI0010BE874F|nr:flavodoxin domain-containing protein [Haloprofundus sp. MHR1]QCJ46374.1 protoporphyrinogen oxidase [Haloprofundus sp. MHR1]